MENFFKYISFSKNHENKYLILKSPMILFDVDFISEEKILKISTFFSEKYKHNLRIYKSKNGYRIFLTDKKFNILVDRKLIYKYAEELNSDQRYFDISLKQNYLFPIRVAPKQIDAKNILDIRMIEEKFQTYMNDDSKSVARYITTIGNEIILDEFKEFINLHDQITKAFNKNCILS